MKSLDDMVTKFYQADLNLNREGVLITAILQYWLFRNQYSSGIWRHNGGVLITDYRNHVVLLLLLETIQPIPPRFLDIYFQSSVLNSLSFTVFPIMNAGDIIWRHIWTVSLWFRRLVSILSKQNILVRQTPLSSRLTSNRHVGRTVTDKSLVIHQKN